MENKRLIIKKTSELNVIINKLKNNKFSTVFVVDDKYRLIGSITIGDLRRYLLKQSHKFTKFKIENLMNKKPFILNNKTNFEIEKKRNLKIAPILDKKRKIVALKNLNLNTKQNANIFLMAGGKGKRLYPLTKSLPKPLIKINGKPNIIRICENLEVQGYRKISVSVKYLANKIMKCLKDNFKKKVKFDFIKEKKFLGTAGSLSLKFFKNNYPIVVQNTDIISTLNYNSIIEAHNKSGKKFSICIRKDRLKIPYSVVNQKNGLLNSINEKPELLNLINIGLYVLNKEILKYIKKNQFLDMPNLIKILMKKKIKINCIYIFEDWVDYGTKDTLIKVDDKYRDSFI